MFLVSSSVQIQRTGHEYVGLTLAIIVSGIQPRGRAVPPVASRLNGPWDPTSRWRNTPSIQAHCLLYSSHQPNAIDYQPCDCRTLIQQRSDMRYALRLLAAPTMDEGVELCRHAPRPTQAVLKGGGPLRNFPFMRSISYIIGSMDPSLFTDYVLGLATLGCALHAPTQVPREHWHVFMIQDLLANADAHNKRMISRTRPSSNLVYHQ